MTPSIYLDANVIIEFVKERNNRLRALFERATAGRCRLVTSQLTLAEVLVKPLQNEHEHLASIYNGLLTAEPSLQTIAVDIAILRRSAELRAALGGKIPDSIHVATAELHGCRLVLSYDRRLQTPETMERVALDEIGTRAWEKWPW